MLNVNQNKGIHIEHNLERYTLLITLPNPWFNVFPMSWVVPLKRMGQEDPATPLYIYIYTLDSILSKFNTLYISTI